MSCRSCRARRSRITMTWRLVSTQATCGSRDKRSTPKYRLASNRNGLRQHMASAMDPSATTRFEASRPGMERCRIGPRFSVFHRFDVRRHPRGDCCPRRIFREPPRSSPSLRRSQDQCFADCIARSRLRDRCDSSFNRRPLLELRHSARQSSLFLRSIRFS
jgi:hypothetical protein